jgi:hypothetical protein
MGPNREAVEKTLKALEGRLEDADAARIQMLRSMADSLDKRPFNSQMWKEYRTALEGLIAGEHDDDAFKALLSELSATVRDPKAN